MLPQNQNLAERRRNPTRLTELTDGVFTVILTLLVLELKVPDVNSSEQLWKELVGLADKMLVYFASFLLACVYWIGHRDLFIHVKMINYKVIWINLVFLMICTLIPFGAFLLGRYPDMPLALSAYGTLLFLLSGYRLFMYYYITSHHDLMFEPIPPIQRQKVLRVMLFAPTFFLISIFTAPYFPKIALIIYAVTPPSFMFLIMRTNRGLGKPKEDFDSTSKNSSENYTDVLRS